MGEHKEVLQNDELAIRDCQRPRWVIELNLTTANVAPKNANQEGTAKEHISCQLTIPPNYASRSLSAPLISI